MALGAVLVCTASVTRQAAPSAVTVVTRDGHTARLVSLGGQRTDALMARIGADLPDAVEAVSRFWGPGWQREIVVVATGSERQFAEEAHLDPGRQWSDIAAVSVADSVDPAAHLAEGQRIVFAPGASQMSEPALRIVLCHELFHVAARADTALDAPRWLTEGVADFVARPAAPLPPGAAAGAALPGAALPSDAELDVAGPLRAAGYDRAWWFARFVAQEFGTDALRRLYVTAAGPGHPDFAAAVPEALGLDIETLQARWQRWLLATTG